MLAWSQVPPGFLSRQPTMNSIPNPFSLQPVKIYPSELIYRHVLVVAIELMRREPVLSMLKLACYFLSYVLVNL